MTAIILVLAAAPNNVYQNITSCPKELLLDTKKDNERITKHIDRYKKNREKQCSFIKKGSHVINCSMLSSYSDIINMHTNQGSESINAE